MQGQCRKVMVVEDNFLLRVDLVLYLEDEGHDVIGAGTADEALEILPGEQPVDLIVTDVQLPGRIDGMVLASEVADRWPETRLIVASGLDLKPEQLPSRARFVPKPYGPFDVSRIIDELCA